MALYVAPPVTYSIEVSLMDDADGTVVVRSSAGSGAAQQGPLGGDTARTRSGELPRDGIRCLPAYEPTTEGR